MQSVVGSALFLQDNNEKPVEALMNSILCKGQEAAPMTRYLLICTRQKLFLDRMSNSCMATNFKNAIFGQRLATYRLLPNKTSRRKLRQTHILMKSTLILLLSFSMERASPADPITWTCCKTRAFEFRYVQSRRSDQQRLMYAAWLLFPTRAESFYPRACLAATVGSPLMRQDGQQ